MEKVSEKVFLIECETIPESYIQQIVDFKPAHILIIDAAMLGIKPGELGLLKLEELRFSSAFSTHMLPLRIFCEYLVKIVGAKIMLLLIQPKRIDFGMELTLEVLPSEIEIVKFLSAILPR